jgi:5'-3' exoribonuclease 1
MNQQRARRFRSAVEREQLLLDHVARFGGHLDDTLTSFDSNCITPGTAFMHRLGIAFKRWIAHKMATDSFWKSGATVVFSGADVPGEGEHKIMDMIRRKQQERRAVSDGDAHLSPRATPSRHCLYGLDADLIMLGLVTGESSFVLLREKMVPLGRNGKKELSQNFPSNFEVMEMSDLRDVVEESFAKLKLQMDKLYDKHVQISSKLLLEKSKKPVSIKYSPIATLSSWISHADAARMPSFANTKFDIARVVNDFVFMYKSSCFCI